MGRADGQPVGVQSFTRERSKTQRDGQTPWIDGWMDEDRQTDREREKERESFTAGVYNCRTAEGVSNN